MIPLKLIAPILILITSLAHLGLQIKWHDRRTNKHRLVLRILMALMIIVTFVTCWIVWQDRSDSSKLQLRVDELVEGKNQLLGQNQELLIRIDQYQEDLRDKDLKIQELEMKASPRSLDPEQATKLQKDLASFKSQFQVIIASRLMDAESYQYGDQLANIFRQSGWQIGPRNASYLHDLNGDVVVAMTDRSQRSCAERICSAFKSVGLISRVEQVQESKLPSVKPNTIYIIVGSRVAAKK